MADSLGYSIFLDPVDTVRAWEARGALQPTVRWSEMRHEQHAVAFTVAKITKLDLLRYMQTSLDEVIRSGGTFEGWKTSILPELKRQGWWGAVSNRDLTGTDETIIINERRLRTIYDTNVRMSLASGHWQRIQRQKDVLPYLRYLASTSERKRPLHKLWYGVIRLVDDPWWQTRFPPNGWGCKCNFEQVSERRMQRMGWKVTPPDEIADGSPQTWFPATGEAITVPAGIDPGFGYNPGTAHLRAIADKAANSLSQAVDAGMTQPARATLRELVDDVAFEQFIAIPDRSFPVMILEQAMAEALAATTRIAVLGPATVTEATLPIAIYRQLPAMAENADIVAAFADRILLLSRSANGRWTAATVTRKGNGEGLAVTAVEEIEEAAIDAAVDGAELLVDRR